MIKWLRRRYEDWRYSLFVITAGELDRAIEALQILYDGIESEEVDYQSKIFVRASYTDREWFQVCETWREFCVTEDHP